MSVYFTENIYASMSKYLNYINSMVSFIILALSRIFKKFFRTFFIFYASKLKWYNTIRKWLLST